MIQLITQQSYGDFPEALAEMHRLRYRVFKGSSSDLWVADELLRAAKSTPLGTAHLS